jgi:heme exporter protein C
MRRSLNVLLAALTLGLLVTGAYFGLVVAPRDRDMGDVYRIMFVHVPTAWAAMIAYTVTLVASIVYLFRSSWVADAIAESSAEVGVVLNGLLLTTGAIWGRPTWGVYWTWDPRLTTAAIMMCAFVGYLALRRFTDTPEKRATWSALVAIIAYVDLPMVFFSVRWWNSIHQVQNNARSMVDPTMRLALMANAVALLLAYVLFVRIRYGIARRRQVIELMEPPAEGEPGETTASTGGHT